LRCIASALSVGLEQYGYQGPDLEQLDLSVQYCYGSVIEGRLFAKDDNGRPFDEIDVTFFNLPEARDRKKGEQVPSFPGGEAP
jgi:hypothetical protein